MYVTVESPGDLDEVKLTIQALIVDLFRTLLGRR